MSTARRVLAPATVVALAVVMVGVMLWAGPRPDDLPDSISEVPGWYEGAPEQAFATVVGLTAWLGLLWLSAGLVFAALAVVPGAAGRAAGRVARRMLPRALRRLLEVALGVALVAGTAAPALASNSAGSPSTTATTASTSTSTGTGTGTTVWPDLDLPSELPALAPTAQPPPPQLAPPAASQIDVVPVDGPAPAADNTPSPSAFPDLDWPTTSDPPSPTGTAPPPSATPPPTAPPAATAPPPATPASPEPATPPATTPPPAEPSPPADPIVPPAPMGTGTPGDGSTATEVVVMRGDTLWTIAARHLGPGATDSDVAVEWPRWWAANQDAIGPDPDLILPGQRLVPPPGP